MGKLIEQLALSQNFQVVCKFSTSLPYSKNHKNQLKEADVCIDFSNPNSVLDTLRTCAEFNKPIIIGTTGWDDQIVEAKKIVGNTTIGCLYSPNFSVGVHLFMQIVSNAASVMNSFAEYDVAGIEEHHNKKLDKPSGTAKALSKTLSDQMNREVEFSSVRCGNIPGTHHIYFDGPVDTITLTHQARNREGFAHGALNAAKWIVGKKGFYTMDDWINGVV